jgi:ATP-dependent DNA helicase HFM1/MER3
MSEKRVLNTLNKDKNRATIRFPMTGKIKSKDMKVNCLLQATLGCLPVQEFSLNQDTQKIFRSASRLSKCLMELRMLGGGFTALLNSVLLHKCIQARLWENSKYVARQLEKIGLTISTTLVNAGLTTFDKIHAINPRELELVVNRHPPFGTQIRDTVSRLPKYAISLEQSGACSSHQAELAVTVSLTNHSALSDTTIGRPTLGHNHTSILLVGDSADNTLCKQRIRDSQLLAGGQFTRRLTVHRTSDSDEIQVYYISMEYVGLDCHEAFTPRYTGGLPVKRGSGPAHRNSDTPSRTSTLSSVHERSDSRPGKRPAIMEGRRPAIMEGRRPCNHRCINKDICGHDCCRNGLAVKKV